ncbi:hypothetical protein BDD12DRAFT_257469 [Trichophaea hybrida]|nr:hypothetical protein BDD12DRAFT_257469 [Trichophaea hybrida]
MIITAAAATGGVFYLAAGQDYQSCPPEDSRVTRIITAVFTSQFGGVGPLSFVQAMGIDIAWDLVVGRGGQLLLFWITSCVYTAVLDQVLESKSANIAYDLYISVAISTSSLNLIGALITRLFTRAAFWPKMCFMLYSALYVTAFPTLIAAMTGYISMSVAKVETHNGTQVNLNWWNHHDLNVDGTFYSKDYIHKHCTETVLSDRYIYVLSPWIWIGTIVLHCIWSFGIYGLCVDVCRKSRLHQAGRRLGLYRGILDVAEALNDYLGPDTCVYSDTELRKAIKERSFGRGLAYRKIFRRSTMHLTISPSKTDEPSRLSLDSKALYGSAREETV